MQYLPKQSPGWGFRASFPSALAPMTHTLPMLVKLKKTRGDEHCFPKKNHVICLFFRLKFVFNRIHNVNIQVEKNVKKIHNHKRSNSILYKVLLWFL